MSTFAIGDIQGCYEEFRKLLEIIQFDEKKDQLWLTGDLVNRGPQSLEVLNYLYSIDQSIITVLGNHDLHLIALALSNKRIESKDESLQAILKSKNKINLIEWLRSKPLMHFDQELNTVLVHAGIHPDWSVKESLLYNQEMSSIINSSEAPHFFKHMYANKPTQWNDHINRTDRSNFITNVFTRMRFMSQKNGLDFSEKGSPIEGTSDFLPWFSYPNRKTVDSLIIFGHWSALNYYYHNKIVCLDGGCVWGGDLVAINIMHPEIAIRARLK